MPKLGRAEGIAIGLKLPREDMLPWVCETMWKVHQKSKGGVIRMAVYFAKAKEAEFIRYCNEQEGKL